MNKKNEKPDTSIEGKILPAMENSRALVDEALDLVDHGSMLDEVLTKLLPEGSAKRDHASGVIYTKFHDLRSEIELLQAALQERDDLEAERQEPMVIMIPLTIGTAHRAGTRGSAGHLRAQT